MRFQKFVMSIRFSLHPVMSCPPLGKKSASPHISDVPNPVAMAKQRIVQGQTFPIHFFFFKHKIFKRTLIYYDIDNTVQIFRDILSFRPQNDT